MNIMDLSIIWFRILAFEKYSCSLSAKKHEKKYSETLFQLLL